jgi:carboxyl-terminal processing protease
MRHLHVSASCSMMAPTMTRATPAAGAAIRADHGLSRRCARTGLALLAPLLLAAALAVPAQAQDTAEDQPTLDQELVSEVLGIIGERFVDQAALSTENLTEGALRGILEALGDEGHTAYLSPSEYAAEQDALAGRVLGIGVVLDQRAQAPVIISVIDGSPADRAGLRAGDVIRHVDGLDASRLDLDEIADLVRGAAGSTVSLGVVRPGEQEAFDIDVVREAVTIEPAHWARVPGSDLAVVRIVQFSSGAGAASRAAIQAALDDGAAGIVLDLRGNPGGLVDEALAAAAAFVDGGVAYQEMDREGAVREVRVPSDRVLSADVPLIILVDYATASSAEILAVALRDNARATIVGESTYGTGTVLNTFDLSDGSALKVGVRRWLSPTGESAFDVGVRPDHEVESVPGGEMLHPSDLERMTPADFAASDDRSLHRAVALLEPLLAR